MSEQNTYTTFRSLLKNAVKGTSQKAFAEKAGLSPEHLNRLLNNGVINRPSKKTLDKILKASPSTDSRALYVSCGYDPAEYNRSVFRARHDADGLDLTVARIRDELNYLIKTAPIQSSRESICLMLKKALYPAVLSVTSVGAKDDAGNQNPLRQHAFAFDASWLVELPENKIRKDSLRFAVFYCTLKDGQLMLTDMAMDVLSLLSCGFVPSVVMDRMDEEGYHPEEMPYVVLGTVSERTKSSPAERLLVTIFGEEKGDERPFYDLTFGRGTVWEGTPACFSEWLLSRRQWFSRSEDEVEIVDAIENGEDPDAACADYCFGGAHGTAGAALAVLNRMAENRWEIEYDESETCTDILSPVLYVNEDAFCIKGRADKSLRDKLDAWFIPELKAMGCTEYGTVGCYKSVSLSPSDLWEGMKPIV